MVSQAILATHEERNRTLVEVVNSVHQKWSSIIDRASHDLLLAEELDTYLSNIDAHFSALENRPVVEHFPVENQQREPPNKKIAPQRFFLSTKSKSKRPAELSLRRPTEEEKKHVIDALDGNAPVILQRRLDTDHDYDEDASSFISNDHSYI